MFNFGSFILGCLVGLIVSLFLLWIYTNPELYRYMREKY